MIVKKLLKDIIRYVLGYMEDSINSEFLLELPEKKKKKKKTKTNNFISTNVDDNPLENIPKELIEGCSEECTETTEEYSYNWLLKRIYSLVSENIKENVKKRIPIPICFKEGGKKIVWQNFPEFVNSIQRDPQDAANFITTELGTFCSLDAEKRLIIRGRFQNTQILAVAEKYIRDFVQCFQCKGTRTVLYKKNRSTYIHCERCLADRTTDIHQKTFVKKS